MTRWRSRRVACALLALGLGLAGPAYAQEGPELGEGEVEARSDAGDDARIARRLRDLFASIEALEEASVEVHSGVVQLRGRVPHADAREIAGALAKRIDGVAAVDNGLLEDRSIARRIGQVGRRLARRAEDAVVQLPLVLLALLLGGLTLAAGRALTGWDAPFRWVTPNPFVRDLARQAVRLAFALAGLLIALEVLDATALVGAVLGAAGVAGLALGFAFRDLIENYIASVLLSLRQPFLPDDHVRIGEQEGLVARLTSRATILLTLDGNHVRIPNSTVFKGVIENFTRKPERRLGFSVGLGVDEDITAAQDLARTILDEMPGILADPAPQALVDELGDSSVALHVYAWVNQREADFVKVRSEAIRLVKQAFDRAEIEMPEPTHRIRIAGASEVPARDAERPHPAGASTARDVSPERHLDEDLREERQRAGEDLLASDARRE